MQSWDRLRHRALRPAPGAGDGPSAWALGARRDGSLLEGAYRCQPGSGVNRLPLSCRASTSAAAARTGSFPKIRDASRRAPLPIPPLLETPQQIPRHLVQLMEGSAVDVESQAAIVSLDQFYFCRVPQTWLPTVQEVLQADWQEVWHSPQSGVSNGFLMLPATIVLMCLRFFILLPPHEVPAAGPAGPVCCSPAAAGNVHVCRSPRPNP